MPTKKLWVLAEHSGREFNPVVIELLTEATKLRRSTGCELQAVLLARDEEMPELVLLNEYGADTILLGRHVSFSARNTDAHVQELAYAVHQHDPWIILAGETPTGSLLARRLAVRTGASFVPDYTRIQVQNDSLVITRLVYSGKVGATVEAVRRPLVTTLKPGVVRVEKPGTPGVGKIQEMEIAPVLKQEEVEIMEHLPANAENMDLSEADIVVGGGLGLGSDNGFALLKELAKELNARVGGTRRALDKGWISSEDLIGQTGQTISPQLYIAVGISGASHHIAGIREAKIKISINNDRNASIIGLSDLSAIGDAREIMIAILAGLNELKKNKLSTLPNAE